MCQDGLIMTNYHNTILEINSKRYSLELFPSEKIYTQFNEHFEKKGQYRVAVFCGMGCPSVTSMGTKLLDTVDCDFVMIWTLNIDRKEYVVAMRSREVDISKIAKLFGGGGHKLAGAFSFSADVYNILDLFDACKTCH
jgi:nanoRNase/pAp phosphatase (c-di-AMP/oligoRNAs hydrolase)